MTCAYFNGIAFKGAKECPALLSVSSDISDENWKNVSYKGSDTK